MAPDMRLAEEKEGLKWTKTETCLWNSQASIVEIAGSFAAE